MATTFPKPVYFKTTLAGAHTSGSGTLVLQAGDGALLGTLGANQKYAVTAVTNPGSNETIVCNFEATGLTTDTLTGVTAAAGSTDTAVASGTPVQVRITAAWQASVQSAVNTIEANYRRTYTAAGSGTGTTISVPRSTHGLGTAGNSYLDVDVVAWNKASNPARKANVDVSVSTSSGDVTVTFTASQTLTNFQVTITGP